MNVFRASENPIITPADVTPSRPDFETIGVFNAGVARYNDTVLLLLRVAERPLAPDKRACVVSMYDAGANRLVTREFDLSDPRFDFSDPRSVQGPSAVYLTSLSYLRIARSRDGVHFEIDDAPALFPDNIYEAYGIEDPRISVIGGRYYVNYSAVSSLGVATALASTEDFVTFQRHGIILPPDNKDVAIFPEKIQGRYYALHRPSTSALGRPEIWLAESPDLLCWGHHRRVIGLRPDSWESARIGGGAVPFRIDQGWVEIYHGADTENRYCLGAVLLDADEPWKVIARSRQPILEPQAPYECEGFFGDVVFSCGALYEEKTVKIYYGVADTSMAYAEIAIDELLNSLTEA